LFAAPAARTDGTRYHHSSVRRLHLFEFEDLPWVPKPVRDGGRDVLDLLFARIGFYRGLVGNLRTLVAVTGDRQLVDLCSGGGGGALAMRALLTEQERNELSLVLSDRYPNAAAVARVRELGDARVSYRPESVDALAVPKDLQGLRTMYGALHHFRPEQVQRLIESAIADKAAIAFFDVATAPVLRKLPLVLAPIAGLLNFALLLPVPVLMVPATRPFRWSRVLFTYVLPLIPLLFAWDGTISAMRAYGPDELLELARTARGGEDYVWEVAREDLALCLLGYPKR
jgi:hypothetical protein